MGLKFCLKRIAKLSLTFLLWFSISLFLVCFWVWTIYAVLKQKKAWKFYADMKKLRYHSNGFLETPTINGLVNDYKISIFASEHSELDSRFDRRLTAIEVSLQTRLPAMAAVASGGMVPIIETLDMHQEFKPTEKGWDDSYVIRTNDREIVQAYLNDKRLQKMINLMKKEKAWLVLIFVGDYGLLRLDTPLPIDQPKEMDKLINELTEAAAVLELEKGEENKLIRKSKTPDQARQVLEIDEDLLTDDIGLELEE